MPPKTESANDAGGLFTVKPPQKTVLTMTNMVGKLANNLHKVNIMVNTT